MATIVALFASIFVKNHLAAMIRLAILARIVDVVRFDTLLWRRIHTHISLKKLYQLFKLVVAILLVSHLVGCVFYQLDKQLLKNEYYGSVALNPKSRTWVNRRILAHTLRGLLSDHEPG